jgi:hypothetical protein
MKLLLKEIAVSIGNFSLHKEYTRYCVEIMENWRIEPVDACSCDGPAEEDSVWQSQSMLQDVSTDLFLLAEESATRSKSSMSPDMVCDDDWVRRSQPMTKEKQSCM